jgi:type VI secretion system secreted protein Hcp
MTAFFVTIEGTKQGLFKGESTDAGHRGAIVGLGFSMETTMPVDSTTKLPTGHRQHAPVHLVKEWDAASPAIMEALVTNEVLKSVVFDFTRTTPGGTEELFQRVQLQNATVIDHRRFIDGIPPSTSGGGRMLEDVSFTYQKIIMEDVVAATTSTDSWS